MPVRPGPPKAGWPHPLSRLLFGRIHYRQRYFTVHEDGLFIADDDGSLQLIFHQHFSPVDEPDGAPFRGAEGGFWHLILRRGCSRQPFHFPIFSVTFTPLAKRFCFLFSELTSQTDSFSWYSIVRQLVLPLFLTILLLPIPVLRR